MELFLPANLLYLRKRDGLSQEEAAQIVGFGRSTYANWEAGGNDPDLQTVVKFADRYKVSVDELLTTDLTKGNLIVNKEGKQIQKKGNLKGNPKGNLIPVQERSVPYGRAAFSPAVITVDQGGEENILYVPVAAQAGYLVGFGDAEYLSSLPSFRMPGLANATYRMFEVSGPSMAPTIGDNDRVIASYVESLEHITDGRVYVVVTEDGIVIKRLLNRISQRGKIVLKSDTIAHRSEYKTYELDPQKIREIWYCRMKMSADFSEPSEVYHRLNDLESDMVEIKQINSSLLFDMHEIRQIIQGKGS